MASKYVFLLFSVAFNIAANFTLKAFVASRHPDFITQLKMFAFYLAVAFFGINFLFYAKALQNIPISLAYPIVVGLSVAGLVTLSMVFLNERLTLAQGAGIFLIVGGIILVSR
ncbi:MAG TPA: SMR family transporter [Spirochaetota bacterium]|nr:SMR family transporter [Spirochaetota bacterium]HRT77607.1 SMR family transporter [Spirochaetota bacterium]